MIKKQYLRKTLIMFIRNKRQKYPIYENTMILCYCSRMETCYIFIKKYFSKVPIIRFKKKRQDRSASSKDHKTRLI